MQQNSTLLSGALDLESADSEPYTVQVLLGGMKDLCPEVTDLVLHLDAALTDTVCPGSSSQAPAVCTHRSRACDTTVPKMTGASGKPLLYGPDFEEHLRLISVFHSVVFVATQR